MTDVILKNIVSPSKSKGKYILHPLLYSFIKETEYFASLMTNITKLFHNPGNS